MYRRYAWDAEQNVDAASDLVTATRPRLLKKRSWIVLVTALVVSLISLEIYAHNIQPLFTNFNVATPQVSQYPFKLSPGLHSSRPASTLRHHWVITKGDRRPDGVLKSVLLVNDAFPGPTIEARSGDRLVIEVENRLDEDTSIHWHGLRMPHTNGMDGAAGVTQDAIPPGGSFVYNFTLADDQSGTFWYHAHSGAQRADGLFGGLVLHQPLEGMRQQQVNDYLLMVGDWYHRQRQDTLDWYMSADSFAMEPVPDSILVNGRGIYNCSDAVPARPVDCHTTTTSPLAGIELDASRAIKLRFVNTGAYSGFTIKLPNALADIVAVDGGNVVDVVQSSESFGVLHPGERVDLLIEGKLPSALEVHIDTSFYKYSNAALTSQQSFSFDTYASTSAKDVPPLIESDVTDLGQLTSFEYASALPLEVDQTFLLYVVSETLAHLDYVPTGSINRTSWIPQIPALNKLDRAQWNDHQFVPLIAYNAEKPLWIDLIVNNLDEEDHAFHLHGHDFFVMSTYSSPYNWGSYNPNEDSVAPGGPYTKRPRRKDTVAIPRRGYAVLRFRADNPGLWMFHCHVIWHLSGGMAMTFEIA